MVLALALGIPMCQVTGKGCRTKKVEMPSGRPPRDDDIKRENFR